MGLERFDIVVVGGGPAGASTAGFLARGGMRVAVCEGKKFPREKVCGEFMGTRLLPVLGELGLREAFKEQAGPAIRRVELCDGERVVSCEMPAEDGRLPRAMGRAEFDALLLGRARELGAAVREDCHVRRVEGDERAGFFVSTSCGEFASRAVVMAHGLAAAGVDGGERALKRKYVSFKTHVAGAMLEEGTIAVAGAAGIYAGLVKTSGERYSLAFVVRRDRLGRFGNSGEGQLAGLLREVPAFREKLAGARRVGPWMASGPLEPGVRRLYEDGRFFVGNAAGEVHALVGEGITLAVLGGKMLAESLLAEGFGGRAAERYEGEWRKMFLPRWRAAGVFAGVMMRPWMCAIVGPLIEAHPGLAEACVRWSGK